MFDMVEVVYVIDGVEHSKLETELTVEYVEIINNNG